MTGETHWWNLCDSMTLFASNISNLSKFNPEITVLAGFSSF